MDLAAEHAGTSGFWRRTPVLLTVVAGATSGVVATRGTVSLLVQDIASVVAVGITVCVMETRLDGHSLVMFVCRGRRLPAITLRLLIAVLFVDRRVLRLASLWRRSDR